MVWALSRFPRQPIFIGGARVYSVGLCRFGLPAARFHAPIPTQYRNAPPMRVKIAVRATRSQIPPSSKKSRSTTLSANARPQITASTSHNKRERSWRLANTSWRCMGTTVTVNSVHFAKSQQRPDLTPLVPVMMATAQPTSPQG